MKSFILVLSLVFSFSAMSEVKVGIVNIQKIIASVKEGKSVNKTLEKSYKSKQKLLKVKEESIKKMQEDFKKQNLVLSEKAKAKKAMEIQKAMQEAQGQMAQFNKEMQKEEAQLKKPILEKLKKIIDEVSASEKVSMTFEITASPVVYVQNKVDLTDKVIKAYDKKHSK